MKGFERLKEFSVFWTFCKHSKHRSLSNFCRSWSPQRVNDCCLVIFDVDVKSENFETFKHCSKRTKEQFYKKFVLRLKFFIRMATCHLFNVYNHTILRRTQHLRNCIDKSNSWRIFKHKRENRGIISMNMFFLFSNPSRYLALIYLL